LSKKKTQFSTV